MRLPPSLALLALTLLGLVSSVLGGPAEAERVVALREEVRTEGLPLFIATNHLGLGAETRALVTWVLAHPGPLTLRPAARMLRDAKSQSIALSPIMARALDRMNQWQSLAATPDHPITHDELRAGALSADSVGRIRAIFEAAIRRGVRIGPSWLTPETGGEATLDRELRLVEARDPRWSTVQDLVAVAGDPKAIAALCESRAAEVALIDTHGLLKVGVARFRLGTPGSAQEVSRALLTVAQNAAPTYSLGPEDHLTLVTGADWRGRYVGGWHTHAPHDVNGQWAGGDVPSFEDMRNAIEYGQYLTLSFQPDGFDLYDAEALGEAKQVDLRLLKVIRHRSPAWREHFAKLRPTARQGSSGEMRE